MYEQQIARLRSYEVNTNYPVKLQYAVWKRGDQIYPPKLPPYYVQADIGLAFMESVAEQLRNEKFPVIVKVKRVPEHHTIEAKLLLVVDPTHMPPKSIDLYIASAGTKTGFLQDLQFDAAELFRGYKGVQSLLREAWER